MITATDYHPEVKTFLDANSQLNDDGEISFVRTAWDDKLDNFSNLFDLIIGSDLLYEQTHPAMLAAFICQHAKQQCTVLIVDPGRGYAAKFTTCMIAIGFKNLPEQLTPVEMMDEEPFNGKVLSYTR